VEYPAVPLNGGFVNAIVGFIPALKREAFSSLLRKERTTTRHICLTLLLALNRF